LQQNLLKLQKESVRRLKQSRVLPSFMCCCFWIACVILRRM